jgi:hypothetical protein
LFNKIGDAIEFVRGKFLVLEGEHSTQGIFDRAAVEGIEETTESGAGGALARAHGSVEEAATVRALLEVALRNENLEVFANGSIGRLVRQGSPNVARRGLVLAINEVHDSPFAPTKSFFPARSCPHPLKVRRLELSVVRLD